MLLTNCQTYSAGLRQETFMTEHAGQGLAYCVKILLACNRSFPVLGVPILALRRKMMGQKMDNDLDGERVAPAAPS